MKLLVLGRDGVLNQPTDDRLITKDKWHPVPGSLEAVARLNRAGFSVVVVTNQQQISSGALSVEDLHDVHEKMQRLVGEAGGVIDAIFFAPTGDPDGHGQRQPKVALLRQVEQRYSVDLSQVTVIGDSRADLEAAKAVGAQAVLVRTGRGMASLGELGDFDGVTIYKDLAGAADALCQEAASSS